MSSLVRNRLGLTLANAGDKARAQAGSAQNKIHSLRVLVLELQCQLESLNQVPTPDVEKGVDFYAEVSRFEVEMIKQALMVAEGHQGEAAQLLNLNTTTLNAMLRRYNIQRH